MSGDFSQFILRLSGSKVTTSSPTTIWFTRCENG